MEWNDSSIGWSFRADVNPMDAAGSQEAPSRRVPRVKLDGRNLITIYSTEGGRKIWQLI
jgi:hypothetical protein